MYVCIYVSMYVCCLFGGCVCLFVCDFCMVVLTLALTGQSAKVKCLSVCLFACLCVCLFVCACVWTVLVHGCRQELSPCGQGLRGCAKFREPPMCEGLQ